MEILISLVFNLAIIYYCIVVLIGLFQYVQREWQVFLSKLTTSQPRGKMSHSYRTDPRNRELQTQLLAMMQGDVPAAKRLLLQQRRSQPGKSDNWYLEKVIRDLERDRR